MLTHADALRSELWLRDRAPDAPTRAEGWAVAAALAGPDAVALQPIVSLSDGAVVAQEALARYDAGRPDVVLDAARVAGVGVAAETAAVVAALSLPPLPGPVRLSVNVSADTLADPEGLAVLTTAAPRLWVEVTEVAPVSVAAVAAARRLRQLGAVIAVDDAGTGFSSVRQVVELDADVVKLDRGVVTAAVAGDLVALAVVSRLRQLASRRGALLVAEGVETAEAFPVLRGLGVALVQGWAVARPVSVPVR